MLINYRLRIPVTNNKTIATIAPISTIVAENNTTTMLQVQATDPNFFAKLYSPPSL